MLRSTNILPQFDEAEEKMPAMTPDDIGRIVEVSPLAAFALDGKERITAANSEFARMLGRNPKELVGAELNSIVDLTDSTLPIRGEWNLINGDGGVPLTVEAFCRRLASGYLVFVFDISPRKLNEATTLEAEKKRWQSQRIEALGRLAGGIAHDFNNFLAVLLLQVDILNLHLEENSPIRDRVNEIKELSNSVAGTVRQLFAFGRKQPMTLAPTELNSVISEFAKEYAQTASSIVLVLDLGPDLGLCFVDRIQIRHILQNLLNNAKVGMPNGGTVTLRTSNIDLAPRHSPDVQPPGQYIEIKISDTGSGLDPAVEDNIFEPFFSNRESDKGAGLTLAMVYGIVKQSKGFIWVENKPEHVGTTFKLQFPRIDLSAPVGDPGPVTANEKKMTRTVLLVDDEAAVRRVTAEFLKMSEYEVLPAANGMEALEIAQSFNDPIHLLLTDLSMPFMDGIQVAEKVAKFHPEASVLYMSGNIDHLGDAGIGDTEGSHFISKPFSSASLADKVREILKLRN